MGNGPLVSSTMKWSWCCLVGVFFASGRMAQQGSVLYEVGSIWWSCWCISTVQYDQSPWWNLPDAGQSIYPHGRCRFSCGDLFRSARVSHFDYTIDKCWTEFSSSFRFSPENPEMLTTLGLLYLQMGENYRAFDYLGNSLTHDPKNARVSFQRHHHHRIHCHHLQERLLYHRFHCHGHHPSHFCADNLGCRISNPRP